MKVMNKISNITNRAIFQVKKHSPEILLAAGIVGTVTSTVLACKATTKISTILEKTKKDVETVHEAKNNEELAEVYTEKDAKKDLAIIYAHAGVDFLKLYSPALILGGLSITSILVSNNILKKRNLALAAAYTAVDKSFKEYRQRVVEKFGEEIDKELKYGIKAKKIDEKEVDPETGKEKTVKKTVNVSELSDYSDYAVYFDHRSKYYEDNDDYNRLFLNSHQRYANDRLRAKGYLTLLDIYEAMDIPMTDLQRKAAMVVGWKYEKDNEIGDNDVCFDIINTYREREDGKVEPCIILDFNVDGNIYERM